ncbi:bifunctional methylenetetrahydrofolate dehydrogenase/methenyltetrahydrofolate cyclohydrolase FolD [Aureimonas ureilytica]|uniref:bifunctional methylenetetrahydrofolate dehydrogenase/methenyltetrahydrofolate cyclohydrolase FolD n=1 Tax=Aureimonas ureilytica TaxID=401562 RepID=UPI00035D7B3B|nr:bifunctional methylenetetrahydrofolate dehydrogenase/methenyltetrahydrofolate cyclohydrolase FolD [Aureimonas ureilytica]
MSALHEPAARSTARVIDGKATASRVLEWVTARASELERAGTRPGIAVVIVGDDPASKVYVASKARAAEACGFHSVTHRLPDQTAQADLLALVMRLNGDPAIHGILVQLPLPGHLDAAAVIGAVSPAKDVDGFHALNAGRLWSGGLSDAFVPCTPAGAMLLVEQVHGRDLSGLEAVVVGRSNIVGKPMAALLLAANATVAVAHSRTRDLRDVCRRADILVAAVGRPGLIGGDWIKPGATVIDIGINRVPAPELGEGRSRLVGDVDYPATLGVAGAVTPVPGGVGPMTIAMLMANTLSSAARTAGMPSSPFVAGADAQRNEGW